MDLKVRHLKTCHVRIGHLKWAQKTPSGDILVDLTIEAPDGVSESELEYSLRLLAEDMFREYGGNR